MKISALITQLQSLQTTHGDVPALLQIESYSYFPITRVTPYMAENGDDSSPCSFVVVTYSQKLTPDLAPCYTDV
jgi:hypothetical protein